ncbi:hypothetical protein LL019_04560, partial [Staphylococcus pseudintermedius]|uniref:hypothetical protein n=1 Tax=Staphylococcus pseudintermedius TaxID=283734 RepID=UPI001D19299C
SFSHLVIRGFLEIGLFTAFLKQFPTRMIIHIKYKFFEIKHNNYKYFHLFKKELLILTFFIRVHHQQFEVLSIV